MEEVMGFLHGSYTKDKTLGGFGQKLVPPLLHYKRPNQDSNGGQQKRLQRVIECTFQAAVYYLHVGHPVEPYISPL